MWQWILCYLSGQHEFGVVCERDAIFLRCRSCGRRSNGWELSAQEPPLRPQQAAPARARQFTGLTAPALAQRQRYSA